MTNENNLQGFKKWGFPESGSFENMIFDCIAAVLKRLIGIEIERKTDLIAFTALLLSVFSAVGLIYAFVKGSKVNMYLHEQVLMSGDSLNGNKYLRLGATVAFSNHGEIGYDATVKQIRITLKFPDNSEYEQRWYQFVTFVNENGELKKGPTEAAVPVQIKAGSALSRDIYFTPFRKRCTAGKNDSCDEWHNYLKWDDFLGKMTIDQKIQVMITAQFLKKKTTTASCAVTIDQHLVNQLTEYRWHSPSCWWPPDEEEI